jgi:hypothetical protein
MIKSIVSLILSGVCLAGVYAADVYKNVALNPSDVRAAGMGFPHASSNSEYPCIYPADTTGGNHCVPDTTFLALDAINGDTLNTAHGSMQYASWGPQLTVPGLWWKVDFGHDVTVDKVKIWLRADWSGGHDSYWKRATLVFSNGFRDTILIDSLKTGQEFKFTSMTTQSITITDFVASNPAKWCAFTEVQAWGYDAPTAVTMHQRLQHTADRANVSFLAFPGIKPTVLDFPQGSYAGEVYSISGEKIRTFVRPVNGSKTPAFSSLTPGIYHVRFLVQKK